MTDTLVSTREVPWMKLGKLVDKPMTAQEAAEQGGLNFQVEKRGLFFSDSNGHLRPLADRVAIVRQDTEAPLGIMARDYQMLQFGEAFDFMDSIDVKYVAAGVLKGGKQGFMVVQAPVELGETLTDVDPHDIYVILRTSHDGSRAVEVSVQPLRQRCMNQLSLRSFVAGVQHRWSIKHTSTMHEKLFEAKLTLANVGAYTNAYTENVDKLLHADVTDDRAVHILENVLPDRPRRGEQIEKIITSWHTAETVGFDYTGWGLVNAVSEYFDWGRSGGSAESRFVGALQGSTYKSINGVAERILALA